MLRNLWFGSLMLLVGFELLGKSMDLIQEYIVIKKCIDINMIIAGRTDDKGQVTDCEEYEA